MKFNIQLDETQTNKLARLFTGEDTDGHATNQQVAQFMGACVKRALELPTGGDRHGIDDVAEHVVADLNRGGWSMVDQPESTHEARKLA